MAEYTAEERARAVAAGEDWLEAGDPEIALMSRFLDDHGDPSEWTEDIARQYETEHNELMGGAR